MPTVAPDGRSMLVSIEGMRHAPENELGMVFPFSKIARRPEFVEICRIQPQFPACWVSRRTNSGVRPTTRMEFESRSRSFRTHVRGGLRMLLGLVFALGHGSPLWAEDTVNILDEVSPAVVTMLTWKAGAVDGSQGTGFIVHQDGLIVTAWHVVTGASKIEVRLATGTVIEVTRVIAQDKERDVALVKVPATALPTIRLGDSDTVRRGERVLVIGSPFGLEQTAADGIVSSVRRLPGTGTMLQVSVPISPGSSGGPVVNGRGEAVGVAVFRLRGGENLSFAVPINVVKAMMPSGEARGAAGAARPNLPANLPRTTPESPQPVTPLPPPQAHGGGGSPAPPSRVGDSAVDELVGIADLELSYGNLSRARDSYLRAIQLRPDHAHAHNGLGVVYSRLGELRLSEFVLKEAIRLRPDYARAYYNLGVVLARQGKVDAAHEAYERLLGLDRSLAGTLARELPR